MKTPSTHIKTKIITGYLLFFILTLVAVVFSYRQIIGLTAADKPVSDANRKLFTIGNTITGLYEAESLSNSFVQTGNRELFVAYVDVLEQVQTDIDTLQKLTPEGIQKSRIDTITELLNQKMHNLDELIQIRQSILPEEFYNKAISSIEASKDSIQGVLNIHQKTITTQDSSFVVPSKKRKGFLGIFGSRKQDSTTKVTVSKHFIIDTINTQAGGNPTDSVINILKSVWTDIQEKNEDINRKINRREYNLVLKSAAITEQLKRILSEFENEEINNSIHKSEQKQQALDDTSALIAKIAIIAILLIVFFCFFILRDISKSQQYRKELEDAKQYTDRLLQNREKMMLTVTHDIKSPLSSIIGYIELFHNTSVSDKQEHYLKNMKNSSEHILNLVTKLLDFSRLDSNSIKPEEVNYNPGQLLLEIGESFIPQATGKHLAFTLTVDESLHREFLGDALRVRQIIMNVLSNAIKYTPKGEVSLTATSSANDKLIVKIKDTGPGISRDEQSVVFNEFTRISSEANKNIEGTGLGLAITHKLVTLLGGKITLESSAGKGSCFTVTLPLKTPHHVPTLSPDKALKILIVDDDRMQLELTASILKTKGFESNTTISPQEALRMVSEVSYDLIFSDIQMPGMNGFELVQRIRESDIRGAKEIPVIALSGRADISEQAYQKAGFTTYIDKANLLTHLFTVIAEVTGRTEESAHEDMLPEDAENGLYTLKNISQFTDNDPEATAAVLRSFIHDTEENILLLEGFTDPEQVIRIAHKMLPLFRQLEVKEAVGKLEILERRDQSAEVVAEAVVLCRNLVEVLQKIYCGKP